jgi:hypothetical protein
MAHDHPEELKRLLIALDYPNNGLFVHIDAKSNLDCTLFRDLIKLANIVFIRRTSINWGGNSIVNCSLRLLAAAYESKENYDYFHMLSGLDYPVKPHTYIDNFFEQNQGKNFLLIRRDVEHSEKIQLRCDQYHFLQDKFIGKKRNLWKYIDFASCYVQRALGIKRFGGKQIYYGSQWWSITRKLAQYFVNESSNISRQYRWTYCADEIYSSMAVINTPFESTLSTLGNLRFVEWKWFSKRDSSPRTLVAADYGILGAPNILFARKFVLPESTTLYKKLSNL